jgi:hypothetical protein
MTCIKTLIASNSINSITSTPTQLLFFKIEAYYVYKNIKLQSFNASHFLHFS